MGERETDFFCNSFDSVECETDEEHDWDSQPEISNPPNVGSPVQIADLKSEVQPGKLYQ